ncbi:hypothetical protein WICPIJ_008793 [Wickerhamomyces pijperi]|uniref:Ubiquitin carboxyl-terminal hydrolase n=1 Tax=Wickerhamomyces pijperi TaxID=599730 RepID=A0A9P8THJ7_WICPI|nr:hypothetical protein WICPIJ_008793 [Wickerhamomyces pijperi]
MTSFEKDEQTIQPNNHSSHSSHRNYSDETIHTDSDHDSDLELDSQSQPIGTDKLKGLLALSLIVLLVVSAVSFSIHSDLTIPEFQHTQQQQQNLLKVWLFNRFPVLSKLQHLIQSPTFVSIFLALFGSLILTDNFLSRLIMSQFSKNNNNVTGLSSSSSRRRFMNRQSGISQDTVNEVLSKGGLVGGLVNDGNTCFMNSVIQSLSSSATLAEYLKDDEVHSAENNTEFLFSKTFKKLLDRLNAKHHNKGRDYRTDPLLKTMTKTPNKSFLMGYNQEDAQEFFQSILHELEEDFKKVNNNNKPSPSPNTAIDIKQIPSHSNFGSDHLGQLGPIYIPASQIDPNLPDSESSYFQYKLITPLDGLSAERIGCVRCGEMGGIRYSVMSGLSLNLPPDNYSALRLRDLLSEWIKPEIIEGVDCNRCGLNSVVEFQRAEMAKMKEEGANEKLIEMFESRIQQVELELAKPTIDDDVFKKLSTKNMTTKTSKSKQILISRPPPLLSIHINRSVFDPHTYRVRKNNARVIFPVDLDLDKYVAGVDEVNMDGRLAFSKKTIEESDIEEEEDDDDEPVEDSGEESSSDDEHDAETTEGEPEFDADADSEEESEEDEELEEEGESPEGVVEEDATSEPEQEQETEHQPIAETKQQPPQQPPQYTNPQLEVRSGPLTYTLRSVIVHYGTHNYGHYIAYRKYRDVWWRISDEDVEIVSAEEVVSTQGVFMLFYELKSLVETIEDENKSKDEAAAEEEQEVEIGGENEDLIGQDEQAEEEEEEEEEQAVNATAFRLANL